MTKVNSSRLPMSKTQHRQIRLLAGCSFQPASWDKRFVRSLATLEAQGDGAMLTDTQAEWLDTLLHKYRRQHGRCPCLVCLGAAVPNPHDRSLFAEGIAEAAPF